MPCGVDFVRDFLVYISTDDYAPQRMKLRVMVPLCVDDMMVQIKRQSLKPGMSLSYSKSRNSVIPSGSRLFAFDAEQNYFVPIDSKSTLNLQKLDRLLVCLPCNVLSAHPGAITTNTSVSNVFTNRQRLCSEECGLPHSLPPSGVALLNNSQKVVYKDHSASFETNTSGFLPRSSCGLDSALCKKDDEKVSAVDSASFSACNWRHAVKMMLDFTGFVLSEYVSRSGSDITEPSKECVWSLMEEVLQNNCGVSLYSLDPETVDAFVRTIATSISVGRFHRQSRETSTEEGDVHTTGL